MCEEQAKLEFEAALTDEVYQQAWTYSWRLCGNREQAEDLFQDALAYAYISFVRRKPHSSFRGWLLSIVRTQFLIGLRKQKTKLAPLPLLQTESHQLQSAAHDVGLEDLPTLLGEALSRISKPQREALELHYLHKLKVDEVGVVLRINPGTVKARLHRGRLALKKVLIATTPAKKLSGGYTDE